MRLGGSVIGVDASDENIKIAKLHAKKDPILHGNLEYQCITAGIILIYIYIYLLPQKNNLIFFFNEILFL